MLKGQQYLKVLKQNLKSMKIYLIELSKNKFLNLGIDSKTLYYTACLFCFAGNSSYTCCFFEEKRSYVKEV